MTNKNTAKQTSSAPILPRKSHGRPPGNVPKVTPELKANFLVNLANNGGIVADACKAVDISRTEAYRERDADPEFMAAWIKAVDDGIDVLEDEAKHRAKDGVHEPIFFQGAIVGYVRRPSDQLMSLMLKSHRARYTERHEITGPNGGPLQTTVQIYLPENGRTNGKKKPRGDK